MKVAGKKEDDVLHFVTIVKEHGMLLLCKIKKSQDKNTKENATLAVINVYWCEGCLLYTSPSPRDGLLSRMPSSA